MYLPLQLKVHLVRSLHLAKAVHICEHQKKMQGNEKDRTFPCLTIKTSRVCTENHYRQHSWVLQIETEEVIPPPSSWTYDWTNQNTRYELYTGSSEILRTILDSASLKTSYSNLQKQKKQQKATLRNSQQLISMKVWNHCLNSLKNESNYIPLSLVIIIVHSIVPLLTMF